VSKPKVLIVGYENGFRGFYEDYGFQVVNNPLEADLYQFTGGEDVTPELYNCLNTHSYNNLNRDLIEAGYFTVGRRLNKPMVGVCRGGQFLNVMCGGAMLQHVSGHTSSHPIKTTGGTHEIMATSTHHQMMIPSNRAKLLAWANIVHPRDDSDMDNDPEVLFYEQERCLCFQPHPEYRKFKELEEYFFELVNGLLLRR